MDFFDIHISLPQVFVAYVHDISGSTDAMTRDDSHLTWKVDVTAICFNPTRSVGSRTRIFFYVPHFPLLFNNLTT